MLTAMLLQCLVFWIYATKFVKSETFPSLINANATLAIIIDREYLGEEYDKIKTSIETYLVFAKREILKNGGVNVNYFSWTAINVKRDITAILSIAPCEETWRLFRAAREENLLHMAISESDCPRLPHDQAITIPLLKLGEELPQLLLDLRTARVFNWKSAVVLSDHTLSRDLTTRIIRSVTEPHDLAEATGISLLKINQTTNSSEIQAILSQIRTKTVGGNFLVIVSLDMVETIMEVAKSLKLVNTKNQWLYIVSDTPYRDYDFGRFKRLLHEGDNVAFIYNTTESSEQCVSGITCHSEEILEAFTRALETAILDEYEVSGQVSDEEWEAIRPSKFDRRNTLLEKIKSFLLKNGACGNCTSWTIKTGETWGREYQQDVLNDPNKTTAELISAGKWRPIDGPSMADELFPHISHGFRGKNLPMISFHNPPWQIIRTNSSGGITQISGLVFDIINELANNLNFTYTVHIAGSNNKSSSKNDSISPEGNLIEINDLVTNIIPSGIIDMVMNKSMVLGACGFTITNENKQFINFTIPISTQTYTFLVARPRELSRALLFISPFTGDTWLCLAACIVSMGPILYYIHRYSPVYEYRGIRMKGGLSSIQNCIWYMYGALLQQGGMHLPTADSARIIVGAWWLVVLVVATTYCGNLVAFLTFPKIDIPITTIDDLLAHRDTVTWSFPKDSFLEHELRDSEFRYKKIYDGRLEIPKSAKMIKNIEQAKHVYIDWKIRLQHIMKKQYLETGRCDLALGLDEFYDEQIALILSHDSPYITRINEEIKKLHQVGLIQKWLKDYLPKKDRCWKNRHIVEVNNHTVNMDDMQGSFFVLCFGFLLSLFLIIGEKVWFKQVAKKGKRIIQPFTS